MLLNFLYIKVIKRCLSASVNWRLGLNIIDLLSVWDGGKCFSNPGSVLGTGQEVWVDLF